MLMLGLAASADRAARMSQINPFTGAVSLPPNRSVAERVRRSHADAKHLTEGEAAETVIESPDAVVSISDDQSQQPPEKRHQHKDKADDAADDQEEPSRLDVTA
jgi:hypothetical protein